ncbi:hypothetical protein OG426_43060 [Streptomyces canus]|uniref:hypothetical protein n=1 Tax=Streptomyces canus TaxID=58343 RepID=UPI0038690226|nr:hypothetical protein OG426_43060 [Streptomyces canus]
MNKGSTTEAAEAAVRHARFGSLPECIRFDDMTTEVEVGGVNVSSYDPEGSWKFYSCLALDLGL